MSMGYYIYRIDMSMKGECGNFVSEWRENKNKQTNLESG